MFTLILKSIQLDEELNGQFSYNRIKADFIIISVLHVTTQTLRFFNCFCLISIDFFKYYG